MCASPAESPRDLAVHLTGEGGWPAEQGGHPGRLRTRTTPFMLLMSLLVWGGSWMLDSSFTDAGFKRSQISYSAIAESDRRRESSVRREVH